MVMGEGYLLADIERLVKEFGEVQLHWDSQGDTAGVLAGKITAGAEVFKARLCDAVFRLRKEKQVCLLVEKYYYALVVVLDELLEDQASETGGYVPEAAYGALNGLLLFIEKRFSAYLNPGRELGPNYISLAKKDWAARLKALRTSFEGSPGAPLFGFVSESLLRFINAKRHCHLPLSALLYRKELILEIELLSVSGKMARLPRALEEVLLYMNFNSMGYLEHYSFGVAQQANAFEPPEQKAAFLRKRLKKLKRLYCNTGIGLHPGKENLKAMIRGWLEGQLQRYDKKQLDRVLPFGKGSKVPVMTGPPPVLPKVSCTLTVHQLGILLRAADQAQLIRAPSLSAVFKAIVPFLSTLSTQDLSPGSVRSKSYLFEEKDREDTIIVLENLIEKIRRL